jgi:F-type H+-transporting ATPase subunit b
MLTARVTKSSGHVVQVRLVRSDSSTDTTVAGEEATTAMAEGEATTEAKAPNPIAPASTELYWSAGAFIVLLVAMRYYLFPKVRKGMTARYESIRSDIEGADAAKAGAHKDVAEYEKALAAVRAEANARVDAARQTLDSERTAKLAEVNARISAKRAEADAANAAAREAARGQVAAAVTQVAARAAELATGRPADPAAVNQAVTAVMEGAR